MTVPVVSDARSGALGDALAATRERIAAATRAAGRLDEPTLVVVTKFFPVEDLVALADLGVGDVGENREQELVEKVQALEEWRPDLLERPRRHFIGQLQSKKAKRVARYADVVHSVDRAKLVAPLSAGAQERGRSLDVFVQVDLEDESRGRGGVRPEGLRELAEMVEGAEVLRLRGLMAVAPLGEDPKHAFARLAEIRSGFVESFPHADQLSAGMSGDLEEAVAIGATHLRVGSAILGSRPAPR